MITYTTLDSGLDFPMGRGRSSRVVSPEVGAHQITLNLSIFEDGDEFPQHVHDISEDCFIVLDGSVSLRQGEKYTPLEAGQAVWVPIGEVHGTYNHSGERAELISFQSPPDLALYSGQRDGTHADLPQYSGSTLSRVITLADEETCPVPGATVTNGEIRPAVDADRHARRLEMERIELEPGGSLRVSADGMEHVIVVLAGDATAPGADEPLTVRSIVYGTLTQPLTLIAGERGVLLLHSHAQPGSSRPN
ncbi:cupin domain-containing protein [Microbacterium azadirachtae]|uniref:Cupin domain protein n=1 Tax=Microbacterium azadirachtae TaxID=582680 RepID=A0A0F0LUP4_9MICO|nr:cupin domain-containing protein [Microbacterium azadirachtae]KJL35151.1 Cupin domain protein [Microbacterium azadirachtae]